MNFLAHLHLAHLADSSLPGNLMADFVRGNPQGDYPAEIIDGIFMHRRIDVMTDNLAEVKEAREWFRPQTRRVAPSPSTSCGIISCPSTGRSSP